jgi:hypothetical protein
MTVRPSLALPITAVVGVAIAFLLRETVTRSPGFTITDPRTTRYIGGNEVYFWGVLSVTLIACLLLWRRARRLR